MSNLCFLVFSFVFILFVDATALSTCTTPNGDEGVCVRLNACPVLLQANQDESNQAFVDESAVGCGNKVLVFCCGAEGNYTKTDNTKPTSTEETPQFRREQALKLLPGTKVCGQQHWDDYPHHEGDGKTSVDEFPWVLLVYYDDKVVKRRSVRVKRAPISSSALGALGYVGSYSPSLPEITYQCTGVLISSRYALTVGSCISDKSMWVTLGQHVQNQNVSCTATIFGVDDCTNPAININITEKIKSPDNSVVLLRLEKEARFTSFIRALCLPLAETDRPQLGDKMFTSGWGVYYTDNNATIVKKRIVQSLENSEECDKDGVASNTTTCVKQQKEHDYVCEVDRGGPMMHRHTSVRKRQNWFVEGLVDVHECANDTVRGVRITPEIVDWVLDNIKP